MNFLNRILQQRHEAESEAPHGFGLVNVCYEATISFETDFLVHFYDAADTPFLLEKKGHHFRISQDLPYKRSRAYFRVHVFNPMHLPNQTVTISIKVRNQVAVARTFAVSSENTYGQWNVLKANLI